jgi:uncharacterized membrane protein YbhN (UPF0104 family)/tRNA A-37 threonylcarbamoyl transferase component Bud32
MSYLISSTDQPRVRRASDITTVVVGLVFVAWGLAVFGSSDQFQQVLSDFASSLPKWVVALLTFGYTLGLLYVISILVLFISNRRWSAVRDVVLAGVVAAVTALTLVAVFDELWPPFFTEFFEGPVQPQFPVVRVAVVTAMLVASTPYVARPIRRLGWVIVILVSAAAMALALSVPSGVWAAVGVGLVAGSGVLLLFGSPRGYPDIDAVKVALGKVGLQVPDLALANDQSWGARRLVGTTAGGVEVMVKAYGRDATDSQGVAKLWHALMYRGGSQQIMFSRLQSVEHEALLTMLAGRAGAMVPKVLVAAAATDEVALLATVERGVPLSMLPEPSEIRSDLLSALWSDVADMHSAGIVHGHLDADAILVAEHRYGLADFGAGSVDYQESDAVLDYVQLLFATSAAVGAETAVGAAARGLGTEALAEVLGYLQPPAIDKRARHSVPNAKELLGELRDQVADVCDTDQPEPVKLRRFGIRDILTIVLVLLFLSALVPLLTGVDYAALWDSLKNAEWWLVLLALLMGQLAFIPQGTSMMAAVARAIPLKPMTILQPAVSFISFAIPGVAGRVTMEGAFLYKFGVSPTVSVTKGAVDAFAGFLVQVVILIAALLTGAVVIAQPSDASSDGGDSGTSWAILVLALVVVIGVVIAVFKVPKLHDKVIPQVRSAWEALTEVLRSPKLALALVGSQFIVQMLWGLALWLALQSLGISLSLIACTGVVVATALLQGLIPVPGGIGVSEAVMSAFLVPLGVPADIALGAAVIWRVATFYLPATEGFFASKYLSKRGYL